MKPGDVMTGEMHGRGDRLGAPSGLAAVNVGGGRTGQDPQRSTPGRSGWSEPRVTAAPSSAYLGVSSVCRARFSASARSARPEEGPDGWCVSAASGAVGSVTGLLAKRPGARVVRAWQAAPRSACGCRTERAPRLR